MALKYLIRLGCQNQRLTLSTPISLGAHTSVAIGCTYILKIKNSNECPSTLLAGWWLHGLAGETIASDYSWVRISSLASREPTLADVLFP